MRRISERSNFDHGKLCYSFGGDECRYQSGWFNRCHCREKQNERKSTKRYPPYTDIRIFYDFKSLLYGTCLLYTSDAADEEDSVDLGGRRIIKKKKKTAIPLQ